MKTARTRREPLANMMLAARPDVTEPETEIGDQVATEGARERR